MQNRIAICILLLAIWSTNIFAQISAYHGIVFPYESSSRLPQSIGGITTAIPDFISAAQINPAGLAINIIPQVSIHFGQNLTRYKMDSDLPDKPTSLNEYNFYNGLFSGSIPIDLFHIKAVFAISANKIHTPEFEIWEALNEINNQPIHHSRKGSVWNTTFGIGGKVTDGLSYGLSMTKWFGHWSWHDEIETGYINGEGKFKYSGFSFTLGLLQQFRKISLAVAVHTPFTLMKSENVRIKSWFGEDIHHIEQYFKGAARFGIAYHLNPQLILAAGYRYQGNILLNDRVDSLSFESFEDKYGPSHQISLGGEYIFNFDKIDLPVFLAYRTSWMRDTQRNYLPGYQILSITNGKDLSHEIVMGLNLFFKSYGIYFTTQWNSSPIQVLNEIVPPFS